MSALSDMAIDQMVLFTTKNANDSVYWKGTVEGFLKYNTAKTMGDITSYHTAVKKVDPSIADIEDLSYFVIALSEVEADQQPFRIFAKEWIEDGSFEILDVAATSTIRIYDIGATELDEIIASLKVKGYRAEIL